MTSNLVLTCLQYNSLMQCVEFLLKQSYPETLLRLCKHFTKLNQSLSKPTLYKVSSLFFCHQKQILYLPSFYFASQVITAFHSYSQNLHLHIFKTASCSSSDLTGMNIQSKESQLLSSDYGRLLNENQINKTKSLNYPTTVRYD